MLAFFDFKARTGSAAPSLAFYLVGAQSSKEPKMREIIRFAWGISFLGGFMVAMSAKGLVAMELGAHRAATESALRARFPEADVVDSQQGLTDVVECVKRAIEEPGFAIAVPLDLRGTVHEVG